MFVFLLVWCFGVLVCFCFPIILVILFVVSLSCPHVVFSTPCLGPSFLRAGLQLAFFTGTVSEGFFGHANRKGSIYFRFFS